MDHNKVNQTWFLLKLTYTLVPIIIGLDKCFGWWLVNWLQYTSPMVADYLPASISVTQFVVITGIIEIVAGVIVWVRPRLGAYIILAWMLLVIGDLASMNKFYDIIARDGVIALGALALAWLSEARS